MTEPRVFTIEEVQSLIPELTEMVRQQLSLRSDIEKGVGDLATLQGAPPTSLDENADDPARVLALKREIRSRVENYERGWNAVEKLGAVVKDPRIGLLDFFGHVEGKLVWLCWRFGEARIEYYHDLDAGFAGRRAIHQDTRKRHLN